LRARDKPQQSLFQNRFYWKKYFMLDQEKRII
jgi:hypothetical protein